MNAAIIAAGGAGKRFGGGKAKQFLEILGKPVVAYALERFESCSLIDEIVLVLPVSEIENFSNAASRFNLKKLTKIVAGGETRAVSVLSGLNAVDAVRCEIVVVHDGARPLVDVEEISRTVEKAKETGAACLVAEVTDTIKEVAGGAILKTIERANLRRALTPQAFRYEILKRAFESSEGNEFATDESSLVERIGVKVSIVEGAPQNIKITRAEDLILAERLLKQFKVRGSKFKVE